MVNSKITQRLQVKACIESIKNINELSRLFYKELFYRDRTLEQLFPGGVVALNRKFSNMMSTLKNVEHLEKISESLAQMGARHLQNYGVKIAYFDTAQTALLAALNQYRQIDMKQAGLTAAWISIFTDVSALMIEAINAEDDTQVSPVASHNDYIDDTLLVDMGGEHMVTEVHKNFYDDMFEHAWLKPFFYGKSKESLIMKQSQFMVAAFGGENQYQGDTPAFAHMHMFITEDMLNVRQDILRQAILKTGLTAEIAVRWLRVDDSFRAGIIKKSVDECVLKCYGQAPVVIKDKADLIK